MYDIKTNFTEKYEGNTLCPFCRRDAESFEHIFKCQDGLICPLNRHDITDNNDIMHNSVGHKPMSKQQFWRLKETLTSKSISTPIQS